MNKLTLSILILLILSLPVTVSASMTKIYIGDENGQTIFGIDATVANYDGAIGAEIRSYIPKRGIVVNGQEYGSLPSRTMYNWHLAGKSVNGMIRYDNNTFVNYEAKNDEQAFYNNSSIVLRGGNSNYLFYE
jgi:hypothetical protein